MDLGSRRSQRHPDRRDVGVRHQGDENHEWPAGILRFIEAFHNWTARTDRASNWRADTIVLTAGESRVIAGERRQRCRAVVFTDAANTVPVWLAAGPINQDPAGISRSNALPLAPGSAQLELTHSGAIHARANVAATVYIVEEYLHDQVAPA